MRIDFSQFAAVRTGIDVKACDLGAFRIDLSAAPPPTEFLFAVSGVGAFPRGDIQAVKAKAKQGKSYSLMAQLAGAMSVGFGAITPRNANTSVLHIDTEQGRHNIHYRAKVALKAADRTIEEIGGRYNVYTLRECGVSERVEIFEQALEEHRPDWVILDGVVDIIADFNDTTESKDIVSRLLRLATVYRCAITCVLHENKGVKDGNMRGHLGTEIANKASEVYRVERSGTEGESPFFTVSQTECRNKPVEPWYFTINADNVPEPYDHAAEPKTSAKDKAAEDRKQAFEKVLCGKRLSYAELARLYGEETNLKERASKAHIKQYTDLNFLTKHDGGFYTLADELFL